MTFVRRFGIPILGVVVAVIGVFIYEQAMAPSFGWTAYAPLSGVTFVPNPSPSPVIGVAAVVLGLVVALGFAGFRAGQRSQTAAAVQRWWPFALGILLLIVFALDVAYWTQQLAFMSGEAIVGSPESYRETGLSFLTGLEYGGQIRVALLAASIGCLAGWGGSVLGRRRPTATSPR